MQGIQRSSNANYIKFESQLIDTINSTSDCIHDTQDTLNVEQVPQQLQGSDIRQNQEVEVGHNYLYQKYDLKNLQHSYYKRGKDELQNSKHRPQHHPCRHETTDSQRPDNYIKEKQFYESIERLQKDHQQIVFEKHPNYYQFPRHRNQRVHITKPDNHQEQGIKEGSTSHGQQQECQQRQQQQQRDMRFQNNDNDVSEQRCLQRIYRSTKDKKKIQQNRDLTLPSSGSSPIIKSSITPPSFLPVGNERKKTINLGPLSDTRCSENPSSARKAVSARQVFQILPTAGFSVTQSPMSPASLAHSPMVISSPVMVHSPMSPQQSSVTMSPAQHCPNSPLLEHRSSSLHQLRYDQSPSLGNVYFITPTITPNYVLPQTQMKLDQCRMDNHIMRKQGGKFQPVTVPAVNASVSKELFVSNNAEINAKEILRDTKTCGILPKDKNVYQFHGKELTNSDRYEVCKLSNISIPFDDPLRNELEFAEDNVHRINEKDSTTQVIESKTYQQDSGLDVNWDEQEAALYETEVKDIYAQQSVAENAGVTQDTTHQPGSHDLLKDSERLIFDKDIESLLSQDIISQIFNKT